MTAAGGEITPRRATPSPPRLVAAHVAVALANHIDAQAVSPHGVPWEVAQLRDLYAAWAKDISRQVVNDTPTVPRRLLTLQEVADSIAMSLRKVEQLIHAGDLPVVRIGRSSRVRVEDLDDFINRLTADAPSASTALNRTEPHGTPDHRKSRRPRAKSPA